jgi:hypothetical protein
MFAGAVIEGNVAIQVSKAETGVADKAVTTPDEEIEIVAS